MKVIKNKISCCTIDDQHRLQGEYKIFQMNSDHSLLIHCFYKDNKFHGEYKKFYKDNNICAHYFYQDGECITKEVKALVSDINNITKEERMMIKLKFGIECLC